LILGKKVENRFFPTKKDNARQKNPTAAQSISNFELKIALLPAYLPRHRSLTSTWDLAALRAVCCALGRINCGVFVARLARLPGLRAAGKVRHGDRRARILLWAARGIGQNDRLACPPAIRRPPSAALGGKMVDTDTPNEGARADVHRLDQTGEIGRPGRNRTI